MNKEEISIDSPFWVDADSKPPKPCEIWLKYQSGKIELCLYDWKHRKDGPMLVFIQIINGIASLPMWNSDKMTHWMPRI